MNKYEHDMAVMAQEEKKKAGAKEPDLNNIDPETGKPFKYTEEQEEQMRVIEDEINQMSKDQPQFATKEFSEYMQKRDQSIEKQEELYTDDQPYDS